MKIIYIVRNPTDRAYSHYQLFVRNHFKGKSFSEIIRTNPNIIDLGLQAKHLQKMQRLFKSQNILVLSYDELSGQPDQFLIKVFQFLNVETQFIPSSLKTRINRVVLPDLQDFLIKIKLSTLISLVKRSFLSELIKRLVKPQNINVADKEYLQSKFISDICLLEKMLDIELPHWKT